MQGLSTTTVYFSPKASFLLSRMNIGVRMPAAMGEGQPQSYEPMLGAADAGESVSPELVLRVAGPQSMDSMLGDLAGTGTPVTDASRLASEQFGNEGYKANDVVPRTQEDVPWNPEEPRGYPWQQA